jgi:hypothetical protein
VDRQRIRPHRPAVALGGAAGTPVAHAHRERVGARRRGRAVVDVALDGDGRADPLGDQPAHDHDAFAPGVEEAHLVAGLDLLGGLHPLAVDAYVARAAGGRGERAGLGEADAPDPGVHADGGRRLGGGLGIGHPPSV